MQHANSRANTIGKQLPGYLTTVLKFCLLAGLMTFPMACSEKSSSANTPETDGAVTDAGAANDGATAQSDAGDDVDVGVPTEVTYYQHVKPILDTHCMHCHTPGGAGDFDLGSYELAKMWAPAIVEATQSRRMPPWGAFDTEDVNQAAHG